MPANASSSQNAKANAKSTALQDAIRLVGRAEQCGAGLSQKLQRKGYNPSEIKAAADALRETGMLDDPRYARLWVESQLKRKKSPRELLYSLCKKGLDRQTASAALKAVLDSDTELDLLRRFAAKNGIQTEDEDGNTRKRLRLEGFSAETLDRMEEEP